MTNDDEARRRRRRAFQRRAIAAVAGLHLPTPQELLMGMSFMRDLSQDAQAFAERLLPRLDLKAPSGLALHHILSIFTMQPQREDFIAAAAAFQQAGETLGKRVKNPEECALRCRFYAAAAGCPDSARDISLSALFLARNRVTPRDEAYRYGVAAVGWLLVSAWKAEPWRTQIEDPAQAALEKGAALLKRLFEEYERQASEQMGETKADSRQPPISQAEELLSDLFAAEETEPGVVVVSRLGDTDLSGAKHIEGEFKRLLNLRLPLAPVPDLREVRRMLLAEFPHAANVTDTLLDALVGRPHVRIRPTILLGSPGSGKTTFGGRLLTLLGIPHESYPCGGASDSSLGGTARRWSTGEPSLPLALIRRHRFASPGILLDELEKAATSRHNGALVDVLLGLLEPQSARTWFDPYLQASVDLSHVIWLATANSLGGIPAALRDRCRILRFPDPTLEHLPILAAHLLKALIIERQLDARWAIPLSALELEELSSAWKGGSIRALSRLIEGVLKARNESEIKH